MKLSEFYGKGKEFEVISWTNIDDIFYIVAKQQKEIDVTSEEMYMALMFVIANSSGSPENYQTLITGKIPSFLGVKLNVI